MNELLKHIFDDSACLTRRQINDYINGVMGSEECHAAEHHINSCPFCSEAIEGMAADPQGSAMAVNELDATFLQEHFTQHIPQVHLNSLSPATRPADYIYPDTKTKRQKDKAAITLRNTSIAVVILIGFGLIGYWRFEDYKRESLIRQENATITPIKEGTIAPKVNQPTTTASIQSQSAKPTVTFAKETTPETNNKNDKPQKLHPLILTSKKVVDKPEATSVAPAKPVTEINKSKDVPSPGVTTMDMQTGDDLYNKGFWAGALTRFQQEMMHGDRKQRHKATIMAAHCYENMGQNAKAEKLLRTLVDEGGPKKGSAKRMLRKMDNSQE